MSFEDPFNNAPTDETPGEEAQQHQTVSPWDGVPPSSSPAPAPQVVSVGSEGKVVLTYKGGRDFDAPWVVIHATDLDDAMKQASQFDKLKELFTNVASGGKFFVGLGGGSAPAQGGGGQQQSRAPQQAQQAPGGEQRFCSAPGHAATAVSDCGLH